jgi:multiple antibiotic resistance protein
LFISTFSTLLAIINPLPALPIFLKLLEGKDANQHQQVARRSCLYAMLLLFFFLVFGTLILRIFGVSLSMVRFVGGIILLRIGFQLFSGSSSEGSILFCRRQISIS